MPLHPDLLRACSAMFAYHEATKHTPEKLRASRHFLDWATMPDPFRRYHEVPVIDLPADPLPPDADALSVLLGLSRGEPERDPVAFLSQLFFYSASISATKVSPSGSRYALRVNPSSGNLHPTEFHVLARGLEGLAEGAWHYQAAAHLLESYGSGDLMSDLESETGTLLPECGIVVLLASILWREAWKYQSRAYRYCLHDIGHAWQAIALCGRALGIRFSAIGGFADAGVKRSLGLDDEEPMLVLVADLSESGMAKRTEATGKPATLLRPTKNQLSPSQVRYPAIEEIHAATCLTSPSGGSWGAGGFLGEISVPESTGGGSPLHASIAQCGESFASVVRRRRSALDFAGGDRSLSGEQFSTLLRAAGEALDADFLGGPGSPAPLLNLWLYVHRVDGFAPGLYRYDMRSQAVELRAPGNQQVVAAALSLQQELAGNACVAISMLGNFAGAAEQFGNRGYRYLHFLAGAVGQKLYLASHAMGFGATGIGAFYDDYVHAHLGVKGQAQQVIYHFACGYPIVDPRLSEE